MKINNKTQEETETSSVIRSYFYDTRTKTLLVCFGGKNTDRLYSYHNVPYATFRNFKRAKSKGTAFNRLIRDRFDTGFVAGVEKTEDGVVSTGLPTMWF